MIRKYVLPLAAICGILFAVYIIRADNRPVPAAQPVTQPPASPFASFVAGSGLIESSGGNTEIGTAVPGLITHLYVKPGDRLKRGDPLFQLDDRSLLAQREVQNSLLASARLRLEKLQQLPRPEEVPPVEAQVQEAAANLADLKAQLALRESVADKRSLSADDLSRRRFGVSQAEAKLENVEAQLKLLKAGALPADIQLARADIEQAQTQIQSTQTELDRLTVRAPADGACLQVNIHEGEFAPAGPVATPLILFGDADHLWVRVEIDQNDAWRVKPNAAAVAYNRGNQSISTPIHFVRFEPYVVPKTALNGGSTERVDTRVLQVLYRFDRRDLPLYPGLLVDVFIDAGGEK